MSSSTLAYKVNDKFSSSKEKVAYTFHKQTLLVQPHGAEVSAPHGQMVGGVELLADANADTEQLFRSLLGIRGSDGHHVEFLIAYGKVLDGFHGESGSVNTIYNKRA